MTTIIMAPPFSGKTKYYKTWSQYCPENTWRKNNGGKQVYDNLGFPCGDKIIEIDCKEYTDECGNFDLDSYMKAIKEGINNKEGFIFIASYKSIREALEKENIKYYLLYPDPEDQFLKIHWKNRMEESGIDKNKVKSILDKWNDYVDDFDKESFPYKCTFRTFVNWTEITVDLINRLGCFSEIKED